MGRVGDTYELHGTPAWGDVGVDVRGEDAEDVVVLYACVSVSVLSYQPLSHVLLSLLNDQISCLQLIIEPAQHKTPFSC